jgi:hypothetical protein
MRTTLHKREEKRIRITKSSTSAGPVLESVSKTYMVLWSWRRRVVSIENSRLPSLDRNSNQRSPCESKGIRPHRVIAVNRNGDQPSFALERNRKRPFGSSIITQHISSWHATSHLMMYTRAGIILHGRCVQNARHPACATIWQYIV